MIRQVTTMASPTPQSLSTSELEAPQQLTNLPRCMAFPAYQELLLQGKQPWWSHFKAEDRIIKGEAYLMLKRLLDITIVVISLPLLLPLLALCALLIKLESPGGPVMFLQQRTGIDGKRFGMYKFRTMVPNAEKLKQQYMHLNELQWPDFKITNDPRVTRVGRFLRKTSLDEVPQMLNVLRGDMSLVGPRPTSFDVKTYALWHTVRLEVQPGLTGLWQVEGRTTMEFDERVWLDNEYINRRGLWFDIQILVRTLIAVFQQKGAH